MLFLAILIFSLGVVVHREIDLFGDDVMPVLSGACKASKYLLRSMTVKPELITIDIKHKHYLKLAFERNQALQADNGIRGAVEFEYVPATITFAGTTIPIDIRLKGDRQIHFDHENQWSFRIKTKGDHALQGMKRFSLHKPRARNYVYELLFHKAMNREGLISLRYKFIDVVLNGMDLGIYALEEHFDKRTVEHNGRREGPILRFSDHPYGRLGESDILPFEEAKWLQPDMKGQLDKAISLLESFRQGRLKVGDVFDQERLARFFALTDLLGTHHGTVWTNIRFYYNPIISRFEPIAYDGHYGYYTKVLLASELCLDPEGGWFNELFSDWFGLFFNNKDTFDPEFFEAYIRDLDQLSRPEYLDALFEDLGDELEDGLALIYRNFPLFEDDGHDYGPGLFFFEKERFYERQKGIRQTLDLVKGAHGYYLGASPDSVKLECANVHTLPIEIVSITHSNKTILYPKKRTILLPLAKADYPNYEEVEFALPDRLQWNDRMASDLTIQFRILGLTKKHSQPVSAWKRIDPVLVDGDITRRASNTDAFDFLLKDKKAKTISIKPGQWDITENLIVPAGYILTCGEGTELRLSKGVTILSYSPLVFNGTEERPIRIVSPDGTSQGFAVIQAKQLSMMNYVLFENLANPAEKGWALTGAVTFYESPVEFYHCTFADSRAEDALNLIHSDFTISGCFFRNARSDAFDSDFCRGEILGTSFNKSGNDGIDISGSVIKGRDIFVSGAGDKAVSVGEHSTIDIRSIEIRKSRVVAASKDSSELTMKNVSVVECGIGFTVYQKKPEFGPAVMRVENHSMKSVDLPVLVERGSALLLENEWVTGDAQMEQILDQHVK